MAGRGIKDLPNPRARFQPSRDTCRADGKVTFETVRKCRHEDSLRARLIRKTIRKQPRGLALAAARNLIDRLVEGSETGVPHASLASSLNMRMWREVLIGNLWPLVEDDDLAPAVRADLLPTGMWVSASELMIANPQAMMRRLRSDCDRTGIAQAKGYLFAGLHAEFDIRREGYDFHYHIIAGGEKAEAIENLRSMPKYSALRTEPCEKGLPNRPRVRKSRIPLYNMPDPLTYVLQSSYPHRPTKIHADGTVTRSKFRYRIPEAYHTQWLLWMDRWTISDMLLLVGLNVTTRGFELNQR